MSADRENKRGKKPIYSNLISFLQVSSREWNIVGKGPCWKCRHVGHLQVISSMHEVLLQVKGGFWALIPPMPFFSPFLKKYEGQTADIQSFLLRHIFARGKNPTVCSLITNQRHKKVFIHQRIVLSC